MRYLCTNCSHIYDEALGDEEAGYEAGVKLYEMQDYFVCPVCSEASDSFQEINEEINYLDNEKNLTIEEEMHYPVIIQEDSNIKISIGIDENHPNEESHFISSIQLFDEYGDLVEEKFLSPNDKGGAIFDNYDLDEFEIRIICSLHGVFGVSKILKI
ncbi:MAG: rubredoxin [Candidatus Gracilibacteria bacterium]